MIRSEADSNEVINMEEIHDETSMPFIDAVPVSTSSVHRPRIGSLSRVDSKHNMQPNAELKSDNDRSNEKLPIGFTNDRILNPKLHPSSNDIDNYEPFVQLPQITPDVNIYQHKKTVAQGMMDLALLSANANQMRYVLQTDGQHPYFYPSLAMIAMSLILQIAVGIGLIWNSRYNVKEHEEMCKANKANNWTVIGIFLVTILNVFISSFGVIDQVTTTAT